MTERHIIDTGPLKSNGWSLVKHGDSNCLLATMSLADVPPVKIDDIIPRGKWIANSITVYDMEKEVEDLLNEYHIPHEMKGRAKSIYSIYNKLNKGKKFSDIYDLLAIRILVDTEQECYLALGIIHSKFKPIPKRFKDYVAMPKANMYQSLHTTVFGVDGYLFEIQIRTYEMNHAAEYGIAAHWKYKENKSTEEDTAPKVETETKPEAAEDASATEKNAEIPPKKSWVEVVKDILKLILEWLHLINTDK